MNSKLTDYLPKDNNLKEPILINADVFAGINYLEDNSLDCVVTSPPYWGQRDYGFKGQIGNENQYSQYIEKLEKIFSILKDKLKPKGIFFLNIGDKYLSRYGNSRLGMIPYKLAKFMQDNGWMVQDIIIWYKPNHMPSSVNNRFTSVYEPIFVFAKNKNNYYSEYIKTKKNFSNILKIRLQPTPYNHVAVYPEKLIEELLSMGFPQDSIVLDPFAGSGTTEKAIQNLNQIYKWKMSSILIEANIDYIKIIKERCSLSPELKIIKLPFKDYVINKFIENGNNHNFIDSFKDKQKYSEKNIIKIFNNDIDLLNFVKEMKFGNIYNVLNNHGIIYLGIKNNKIENIHLVSTLNLYGWVIRNQLIIKDKHSWYPIYLIVKDTKKGKYNLNMDAVRIKHKDESDEDWNKLNFLGYKVINTLDKERKEGFIVKILSNYKENMPQRVIIKWNTNGYTEEIVRYNGYLDESFSASCPKCKEVLLNYYDEESELLCNNCKTKLWNDIYSIPLIEFKEDIYPKKSNEIKTNVEIKDTSNQNYKGKFINEKTINFGASPGARTSVNEIYFAVQRIYDFPQEMIADLLGLALKKAKLSKNELTELFPKTYKHTVGHWFRKDLGGSLPAPEDLIKLKKILPLPDNYINLLNSRCIKLQIVKKSHKGKNPGDYLEFSENELFSFLKKSVS